jgi:hypothetical protein
MRRLKERKEEKGGHCSLERVKREEEKRREGEEEGCT